MTRASVICLAVVLVALAVSADAGRSRVDTVVRRMLRTEHDASGPLSSQSGGSIQSTQSGSPVGGQSVNSAGSLSNSVSAVSPGSFPSSSSASAGSSAAVSGSSSGSSVAVPQSPQLSNKKKRAGGGRLTVVSNVNMMNSRQPSKSPAAAQLALMQETIQKGAQESRQKRLMNNQASIEGESLRKSQANDHVLELRKQEAGQKALLLEQDTKRQVHAKAMADEGHAKTMVAAAESQQKSDAKIQEERDKVAAAEQKTKQAIADKAKADAEIAQRKEATDKANAQAKEQTDKAAQKRAEEILKQKQEQTGKADELKKKTAEEAATKKEETAKAKYIIKAESFKVEKGKTIATAVAGSKAYTVMFWYKPEGKASVFTNLLHHGEDDFSRGPAIYMFPDTSQLHVCSAGQPDDAWNQCVDPADMPTDWTHVAVVHGAKGIAIFYNAKQVGTFADTGPKGLAGPVYAGSPFADPAPASLADVRWVPNEVPQPEIEKIFKLNKHP